MCSTAAWSISLLQEYRASASYALQKALGRATLAEREFRTKAEEQLTDPLGYYDRHIGSKGIFRFVATHPDMDHLTGLHRLYAQERRVLENFWHIGSYDFKSQSTAADWQDSRYDQRDWETYKQLCDSTDNPRAIIARRWLSNHYWAEDGVEIWAPTQELVDQAVKLDLPNIGSMILKVSFGGRSVVLGGDATSQQTWKTIYPETTMTGISVLKASHHGRKSGFHWPSVKEMAPWLTITSVGEVEHDATDRYRRYSTHTVSLRKSGDIRITLHEDGNLAHAPRREYSASQSRWTVSRGRHVLSNAS
jgi:beta-lactamase superfamily II metal-dependent hydrolase